MTANTTSYDGGGLAASGDSEIVGNRIEDNTADSGGGLVVFGTTVVEATSSDGTPPVAVAAAGSLSTATPSS